MLALDANVWISAFDPTDRFHQDSVAIDRAGGISPSAWLAENS